MTIDRPQKRTETGKKDRKEFELHKAVLANNISMVKSCIAKGLIVNEKDENSFTPLHYAAQDGLEEIARTLLDAGADMVAKNAYGNTPLLTAMAYYEPSLITLLLERGANKDEQNNSGVSPYSLAKTVVNYPLLQFFRTSVGNEDESTPQG